MTLNRWQTSRPLTVATWALAAAALLMIAFVVWHSRALRPIADDYTIAASARDGLFAGLWQWWQTWSGDATAMFANVLLVGLPLQHLPWALASAVPFLVSALVMAGSIAWITTRSSPAGRRQPVKEVLLVLIPVLIVLWWAFWWSPVVTETGDSSASVLAQGITFWQNLNAAYVVTAASLVSAWVFLESRSSRDRAWLLGGYLVVGIAAGMNGPVFALSALIILPVLACACLLRGRNPGRRRAIQWLLAEAGITLGAAAAHVAPGTQIRAELLPHPAVDLNLAMYFLRLPPSALRDWWNAVISPGTVLIFLVLGALAYLMTLRGRSYDPVRLTAYGAALLGFSLVLSLVNRASEVFAYVGWWHVLSARTVSWMGICCLAIALGTIGARRGRQSLLLPVSVFAAFAALILVGASLIGMTDAIATRLPRWEVGPAPVEGISDIESDGNRFRTAWLELRETRGGPSRGIDESPTSA